MRSSLLCLLLGAAAILSCPGSSWAHPPSQMVLTYHPDRQVLAVSVQHTTHNPRQHRIRQITVVKNNGTPLVITIPRQPSTSGLTEEIPLAAVPGDVLHVTAVCNQGGSEEAELTVKKPQE